MEAGKYTYVHTCTGCRSFHDGPVLLVLGQTTVSRQFPDWPHQDAKIIVVGKTSTDHFVIIFKQIQPETSNRKKKYVSRDRTRHCIQTMNNKKNPNTSEPHFRDPNLYFHTVVGMGTSSTSNMHDNDVTYVMYPSVVVHNLRKPSKKEKKIASALNRPLTTSGCLRATYFFATSRMCTYAENQEQRRNIRIRIEP